MTNQEAITKLTNIMHDDHYSWSPAILTAFGMAVDALKVSEVKRDLSDMISRRAAIDEVYKASGIGGALKALKQLPSAQPEQQNCPYCHEDADGYLMPLEKNIHIYMRPTLGTWTLHFRANGWRGGCVIQYCPMCGRRLTHE